MRFAFVFSLAMLLAASAVTTRAGTPCASCRGSHGCACEICSSYECVKVPDHKTIKKVVYDVKCVPVCEHRPAKFLDCDCCPVCQLKYKKVLIKREIVVCEICTTKCVPVKIPCGECHASQVSSASDAPPAPPIDPPPLPPVKVSEN